MSDSGKLLLNEKEAAALSSMSTHYLRRDRITSGENAIPFLRIGSAIRYHRSDLEVTSLRSGQLQFDLYQAGKLKRPKIERIAT